MRRRPILSDYDGLLERYGDKVNVRNFDGKPGVAEKKALEELSKVAGSLSTIKDKMTDFVTKAKANEDEPKLARQLADEGLAMMTEAGELSGAVENMVDDHLWSLPKSRELMFLV